MIASLLALLTLQPGAADPWVAGPVVVCGEAFALRIEAGERARRHDPGIDFLTYHVEGPNGGFVLYEGNAPQPHDDEIRIDRSWPSVIAIHDNRTAAARAAGRIRDRLLTGAARDRLCPPPHQ